MALYAAAITDLDDAVGMRTKERGRRLSSVLLMHSPPGAGLILDSLETLKLSEKTLVVYTSVHGDMVKPNH